MLSKGAQKHTKTQTHIKPYKKGAQQQHTHK